MNPSQEFNVAGFLERVQQQHQGEEEKEEEENNSAHSTDISKLLYSFIFVYVMLLLSLSDKIHKLCGATKGDVVQ